MTIKRKKQKLKGMDWLSPLSSDGGPRYQQIADLLERAISDGLLKPGDRLPPQRLLAETLGVDLTTVTRGYDEARQRRLLEAYGHRGTYVSAPPGELTQWVDLSMNIPPVPAQIDLTALLKQGLTQLSIRSDVNLLMTYQIGGGSPADRLAGSQWLMPMLGALDPSKVVICPGAQSALASAILTLTEPGETVLTEELVYPGLRTAVHQLGRRIEPVRADEDGMLPDELERACREHGSRVVYLNPTLQNPSTRTIPAERRRELIAAASRAHARIIEDDPYWLFARNAPEPMATLAPDRVIYVSTLSKCLSPGLRTAFVVLPEVGLEDRFLSAMRSLVLMSMPLASALVTLWIQDGSAHTLLEGVKAEVRARQMLAAQILSGIEQSPPSEGIHIWHSLPNHWEARDLAQAVRADSLAVASPDAFFLGPGKPPGAIRISLGGGRDRNQLSTALRNLATLLARKPAERIDFVV
ncbi:transcription regulator protein [Paraburkholderia hospita]|uniref:Transcription regulator protein n=1 Tax=Paraburkholderia hospita TaxID=169430 RepID=A0ABN0F601_9BURK|nr:PLP-dependent aminotransferase family protein [Paraburkholderia hospita]EIM94063.1 transcription regulator protein [Paraburkholderia hospita]OUL77894.1 GntR family transcriptional regulator [Paraburkholderia hospita]